jgi:hypothetical protein
MHYLLSTHYVPGAVLDPEDTEVNKVNNVSLSSRVPESLQPSLQKTTSQNNIWEDEGSMGFWGAQT